jgi:hypothetical protein
MTGGRPGFEVMTIGRAVMVTRLSDSYNKASATERQLKEIPA